MSDLSLEEINITATKTSIHGGDVSDGDPLFTDGIVFEVLTETATPGNSVHGIRSIGHLSGTGIIGVGGDIDGVGVDGSALGVNSGFGVHGHGGACGVHGEGPTGVLGGPRNPNAPTTSAHGVIGRGLIGVLGEGMVVVPGNPNCWGVVGTTNANFASNIGPSTLDVGVLAYSKTGFAVRAVSEQNRAAVFETGNAVQNVQGVQAQVRLVPKVMKHGENVQTMHGLPGDLLVTQTGNTAQLWFCTHEGSGNWHQIV